MPHLPSTQFEEMYEQRRREVNKEFEKYQKQLKAAKKSGSKAAADKVTGPLHLFATELLGMGLLAFVATKLKRPDHQLDMHTSTSPVSG